MKRLLHVILKIIQMNFELIMLQNSIKHFVMIPHVSINPLKSNVEYTLWVDIGNLTDFISVLKRTIT